jgi:hypothetical protein
VKATRTTRSAVPVLATLLYISVGITTPTITAKGFTDFLQGATGKQLFTARNTLIAATFFVVLNACSENSRELTKKISYKTCIGALRLLKHCPLTEGMQGTITAKIRSLEQQSNHATAQFTGEKFKALLKEVKELIDISKSLIDAYKWLN